MNYQGTDREHQTLIHNRQNCTACTQEGTDQAYAC